MDRDHVAARFQTGVILVRTGKVEEGLKELESVAKDDPEGSWGKDAQTEISLVNNSDLKMLKKKTGR